MHPESVFQWGRTNTIHIEDGFVKLIQLKKDLYHKIKRLHSPHKRLKRLGDITGSYINFDEDTICTVDFILTNPDINIVKIAFKNKRRFV